MTKLGEWHKVYWKFIAHIVFLYQTQELRIYFVSIYKIYNLIRRSISIWFYLCTYNECIISNDTFFDQNRKKNIIT